jgi:tRNA pseudouridine32 synthase/23S rRNA pseudouridine746 synthase/23S rRNA pseudouridine1911/1915/1917 synthase
MKKHQPRGYRILYEDRDLLVGNKSAGFVTVPAKWSKDDSLADTVGVYLRKGSAHSRNRAYPVHRLDQATTGVLIFAKSESVQFFLKDNWSSTVKTYFAIVHGRMAKKTDRISSYLVEDDDYVVHSDQDKKGKLSHTEYTVLKETERFSLLKINLNLIRKFKYIIIAKMSGKKVKNDHSLAAE